MIRLCGQFEVTLDRRCVTPSLPGRQGRLVLAYLADNRSRPVTRDELLDLVWPSEPPADPEAVLGALLSKLRRALGRGMLQGRRELTLVLPAGASIDLELAESAIGQAEAALVAGTVELALDRAQAARRVLAGGFLPGYEHPWVQQRRREVEELRLRALEGVTRAGLAVAGGRLATAEVAARELVGAEPMRERGYRLLMEVLAARGDAAAALQTYEQLRVRLRDELGAAPSATIRSIHQRLLSGGDEPEAPASARADRFPKSPAAPGPTPRARAERRHIVASKTSAPRLRPGIVDRPALVDGLRAAAHAPVVVLSAPAGYGKTTLLAQWQQRDERPFAWVSLDSGDDDPVTLVAAIVSALAPVLGVDEALAEALAVPDPALEDVVLPALVNRCVAATGELVLVLDDLHLVTARRSYAVIEYLVHWLPTHCQLALATRGEPPLPLARLRAQGRLAELRAGELALQAAEAKALLAAADVRLSKDQLAQLVGHTEGWPAAVYLAAMARRNRRHSRDFVERFTGTGRDIADFMAEEVLACQPHHVTEFLLRTSVLDELTGSLCDAVTGDSGAQAMLRELERINLFVVPLDEERVAYRYHHLLAGYLKAELTRRDPELLRELHRRASRWYREHGLIDRAVTHAQAARDFVEAADLVAAEWHAMSEGGHLETLRSWIAGFDDAQIEGHPPLAVAAAWIVALAGDGEQALRFADAAQHGTWNGPMPDGTASLESALGILFSAFGLGGLSGMRAAAQRAAELERVGSRWRPLALFTLGVSQTLQGDFAQAREGLGEAVRLAGAETATGAASLAYLAVIAVQEGDEDTAWRHAQRSHTTVERPGLRNFLPSVCTHGVVAELLSRRGDLAGAVVAIGRAEELLPRLSGAYWWQRIESGIRLAPALAAVGRHEEAVRRLDEAETLLTERDDTGVLPHWHEEAARRVRGHRRSSGGRFRAGRADPGAPPNPDAASSPAAVVPLRARR